MANSAKLMFSNFFEKSLDTPAFPLYSMYIKSLILFRRAFLYAERRLACKLANLSGFFVLLAYFFSCHIGTNPPRGIFLC